MIDASKYKITCIVNEDGTEFKPPKDYLREKWLKENPPMRHGKPCSPILGYQENGAPYMNYTCVLCTEEKCVHSSNFKVPDKDREEYDKYLEECREYFTAHNPNFFNNLDSALSELQT